MKSFAINYLKMFIQKRELAFGLITCIFGVIIFLGIFAVNGLSYNSDNVSQGTMSKIAILAGQGTAEHYAFRGTGRNFRTADINGDGYPDIIVAARHHSPDGGIYIFKAKTNLTDINAINADIILRDNQADGHLLGADVAIGDINNDGVNEIIAGDYGYSNYKGGAFIFKTGPTFSSRDTSLSDARISGIIDDAYTSTGLEVVGDVNGDGYNDYVYSGGDSGNYMYLFYGGANLTNKTINDADVTFSVPYACTIGTGVSIGTNADLNNDGYADIIFGCGMRPSDYGGTGVVYVFYGGPSLANKDVSQADVVIQAGSNYSVFKLGVDMQIADLNKDGHQDLIVKDDHNVFIFYGSSHWTNKTTDQADVVITGDPADGVNGYLKGGLYLADINNDGYLDLITAAYYFSKVYVFYGSPSGFVSENASQANLVFQGTDFNGTYVGESIVAGDFNKDGYLEIAATDPNYNNSEGAVFVFAPSHGSPVINITSGNTLSERVVNGEITDQTGIGGVEVKIDNSGWLSCQMSGLGINNDNFTCLLPNSLNNGPHTILFRSKDSLEVYMPPSLYVTRSIDLEIITPNTPTPTITSARRVSAGTTWPTATPVNITTASAAITMTIQPTVSVSAKSDNNYIPAKLPATGSSSTNTNWQNLLIIAAVGGVLVLGAYFGIKHYRL